MNDAALAYFVDNILSQGDTILVWTPVKVHRIAAFQNNNLIYKDIEEVVKKDILGYRKDMKSAIDGLERTFRRYSGEDAENFLNQFGREFSDYKNRFILPQLLKIPSVAALLSKEEGERWLINFQEREIIPLIVQYRNIANKIRDLASNLAGHDQTRASVLYTALNEIEKAMLFSENFPLQKIIDSLSALNINYNVVLFKNLRKKAEMGDTSSPDFKKILKEIAASTGGKVCVTPHLNEGLKNLRSNKSISYILSFKYDGKPEEKKIEIKLLKPKTQIFYRKLFTAKEIQTLLSDTKETHIQIKNFSLRNRILKFTADDFKIDTIDNKRQGMLKILIQLIDDEDNIIYNTKNILKSQKKSVSISIKMPEKYKGKLNVRISAYDLISGNISQINKPTKL